MPKITRTAKHGHYTALRAESSKAGETNDCTVVAFAAVSGVSYEEAHAAMKRQGRKDRKGMWFAESGMQKELEALGLKVVRMRDRDFVDLYPGVHSGLKSITTHHPKRFNKVWANGRTFLFFTNSHVAAVVNGETIDWSNDRACRVTVLYEVVRM